MSKSSRRGPRVPEPTAPPGGPATYQRAHRNETPAYRAQTESRVPTPKPGPHPTVREAEVALWAGGPPFERRPQQHPDSSLHQPLSGSPQQSRARAGHGGRHLPGTERTWRRPAPAHGRPPRVPAARLRGGRRAGGRGGFSASPWLGGQRSESMLPDSAFSSLPSPCFFSG